MVMEDFAGIIAEVDIPRLFKETFAKLWRPLRNCDLNCRPVYEGVNELESSKTPLLKKEGWLRHE